MSSCTDGARVAGRISAVVATLGPPHAGPWWWPHTGLDRTRCGLRYERLTHRGRYSQEIGTLELPLVMLKVLRRIMAWRRDGTTHVFTFECDLVGLSIAFWQSLTGMRSPRHVIVQFIMREPGTGLASRAKHALMRFLFKSVDRVLASSRPEALYYRDLFDWPEGKAVFVPMHTDPGLLDAESRSDGPYCLAAGRTFRDYDTLVRALEGTDLELTLVGGSGTAGRFACVPGLTVLEDIPPARLDALLRSAAVVVVPLHDRRISTGQSVLLQAMALGKPVVATRTAGTVDYVDDGHDGLLVPPQDAAALRAALHRLRDPSLRARLGANARARVAARYLPRNTVAAICGMLGEARCPPAGEGKAAAAKSPMTTEGCGPCSTSSPS